MPAHATPSPLLFPLCLSLTHIGGLAQDAVGRLAGFLGLFFFE
jgi:hypothetical protein